jgi:signal transduction histidine kinase/ActR/RegA family two-component response regulator
MSRRKQAAAPEGARADPAHVESLRVRLEEAEETLRAIRMGEVDAVVVRGDSGDQVYTLRGAEQPYRTFVEQMRDGAAVLTVHGDVLYCNRRFADLVATPMEHVIGGSIERFVAAADRPAVATLMRVGNGTHRIQLVASGGLVRDVYLSWSTTASGGVEQRSLIVADLSEVARIQAGRDHAERESRAKDEFIAMLGHELRNPIGAISSAVQVLEAVGAREEPAIRARAVITRQVAHLARLIDDLLDTGRIMTGKIHLERRPLNWAAVVESVLEDHGRPDRRIDVALEPVWIDADPVRVAQIVGNLLGNAVKFTAPGGPIRVGLATDGPDAVLHVQDDGTGIACDLLPRIFDLFVQGERTLDRSNSGLGLGLTLVRLLVHLHGGSVAVFSEGPGRGSVFTVRMPSVSAPAEEADHCVAPDRTQRRRIAVVEDSLDAREMYRLALELAGHEVLAASDGVGGLELLRSARPDIAFIDIGLPLLDGYEIARRFRAEPNGDRTLLVALTGYGSGDDRARAREAGFDHHLVKPVTPAAIHDLLKAHVGRP